MKCLACGIDIPATKKSTRYCSERCAIRYRSRRRRNVHEVLMTEKACMFCGKAYLPKKTDSKICDNPECKAKMNRKYMKTYWENLTESQRKQKHIHKIESGITYNRHMTDMKMIAICPGCGKRHIVSFPEPGWTGNGTPRIKCLDWPFCARKEYEYDCDDSIIPEIFESNNRASI